MSILKSISNKLVHQTCHPDLSVSAPLEIKSSSHHVSQNKELIDHKKSPSHIFPLHYVTEKTLNCFVSCKDTHPMDHPIFDEDMNNVCVVEVEYLQWALRWCFIWKKEPFLCVLSAPTICIGCSYPG